MQRSLEALEHVILPLVKAGTYSVVPNAVASNEVADAGAGGSDGASSYIEVYPHDKEIHTCYEWMWLLSGEAHMKINGQIYALSPGDFCFVPPLVAHADVYDRATPAYESIWFTYWPGSLHWNVFSYQPFGQHQIPAGNAAYGPPEIGSLFLALQREMTNPAPYGADVMQGILLQLVALLLRTMEASGKRSDAAVPGAVSAQVIEFLHQHFQEDLSLADIATNTYVSPNYLTSLFKRETGRTIFETLAQIRIEQATRLLIEERMPVQDVAREVGYNSLDRFSRVFQRIKGVPPSRYGKEGHFQPWIQPIPPDRKS